MKNKWLMIISIILVILLFVLGGTVIFMDMILPNFKNEKVNEINSLETYENNLNENIELVETISSEEKVSPNCIFIFKTLYHKCEHTKVEKEQVKDVMVNKTREDLSKIYKNWQIITFRNDQVLFYREDEGMCNEHYLLRDLNGYVCIYSIDEDEDLNLESTTSIFTGYLPEEDILRLKEGIRINGKEELNKTLEDYE